jgi:DNA-binding protein H-NS
MKPEEKKMKNERKKSEPEKRNSGAGKTWCGERVSPSSHHHHRVVYIGKNGFGLEREM